MLIKKSINKLLIFIYSELIYKTKNVTQSNKQENTISGYLRFSFSSPELDVG